MSSYVYTGHKGLKNIHSTKKFFPIFILKLSLYDSMKTFCKECKLFTILLSSETFLTKIQSIHTHRKHYELFDCPFLTAFWDERFCRKSSITQQNCEKKMLFFRQNVFMVLHNYFLFYSYF